jgi:hypothetical protein
MRKQSNRVITPMSVIHKLFLICLCLFGPLAAWSQTGNTYVSRDAFYDSLEARAKALSQRLADISGTEPIPFERPPPTILSTRPPPPNPAQRAFDALPEQNPNPAASPLVPTVPGTDDGILYRADGTPVKIKEETPELPVKKGPPRKEMQRDRGQYFIQPFVGLGFISSDTSFSRFTGNFDGSGDPIYSDVDIETKVGHAIGVSLGRRWQNLEGELHFSYATVGYDSATTSNGGFTASVPASGEIELFQVGARVGYGLPVGESGWVRAAGGFGYGKRRDFLAMGPPLGESYGSSDSAFTYDLLFSLGYEIEWGLDAFLAYRLLGSSGNGNFNKVAMHLFEVGLGANF